jgi:hypothetical protein
MKIRTAFGAMLLMGAAAQAKSLHVPKDFATIASALESAADGDTIVLAPGNHTQPAPLKVHKSVTIASRFLETGNRADVETTIVSPATRDMAAWMELAAPDSRIVGITFRGSDEHTLNIKGVSASVLHCRFLGGEDQLSLTRGGGRIADCYFENAGDDGIDCDQSVSWVIENNTIVNAHQDGIEIRLHSKAAPPTTHIFRNNRVVGSGESGLQLIDYQGNSYREFRIHNNVFVDCRGSGVSCMYQEKDNSREAYRGSLMEERAYIYNNTFDGCNYGLTIAPNLIILNNLFVNSRTRGIERGIYVTDALDHSIVDYCLFFNNPEHFDTDVRKGARVLVDRNPQLNPDNELQTGSPCIDAGTARHLWGGSEFIIPRSEYRGTAPDIGAKESGQTEVKAPPGAPMHAALVPAFVPANLVCLVQRRAGSALRTPLLLLLAAARNPVACGAGYRVSRYSPSSSIGGL